MQYLQGFSPLRIKITQFPGGFRLNFFLKLVLPCYEHSNSVRKPYLYSTKDSTFRIDPDPNKSTACTAVKSNLQ